MAYPRTASGVRTIASAPVVKYPDVHRGDRNETNHELLIAVALFAALVIVGAAFFFAVAPTIADVASLYTPTT